MLDAALEAQIFMKDVAFETLQEDRKTIQAVIRSLEIIGEVKEHNRSKHGYEIGVKDIKVISGSEDYPITPKEHGVAFLMENRHLWLRAPRQRAILRIRHRIIKSVREFFDNKGFTLVDAPIFTPSACEGTSNLFETTYFDDKAYLTQSGQ